MSLELGSNSFQFDNVGDSVEGEIISVTEVQASDMDSGQPQFWDAAHTRPKMMPAIEVQTKLRADSADDGRRMIYLSGNRFTAVKRVTRRIDEGAWLRLTFTEFSDREPAKKGYNRAKLFDAEYRAASTSLDLDAGSPSTGPRYAEVNPPAASSAPTSASVFDSLDPSQREALRALGIAGA